ncbi:MBL fold metallo-hydrolase [Vibrio kanaloae]|uniref:MBL fold metallo-hydrolase n=1 Tax=Vibrio kanaloae TaxID=170673 RepID=A0A4V5R3W9_9VIBR|nr:MBL fold metallo-hydrolase [Vibrio kanaloae]TKF27538.1 MBL fold metallo-hydrolase [Vibrio kanaloae]
MLNIMMHKADNGDCISIETQSEVVLIDGGTAQSFSSWKPNIVGKDKIDSVIVTHIDNDHVNGVIKLLQSDDCPRIDQFYFNGAEQLFGPLSDSKERDRMSDVKLQAISEEVATVGSLEKISYSEGTSLSYVISEKMITLNPPVGGKPIHREGCNSFNIGEMKFSVIGPSKATLQELKDLWKDKLLERSIRPKIISKTYYDAFEQYVATLQETLPNVTPIASVDSRSIEELANTKFEDDNSITNRSSLSFLIESNGKRLLYLSDSDAGTVLSWLDDSGLESITVDAVKVSHHGSQNNTSIDLLNRIVCKKYLISTNGNSHGHPNLEVLSRIAIVNKDVGAEIFMNYEIGHFPDWFKDELRVSYPNIKLFMDSCEVGL